MTLLYPLQSSCPNSSWGAGGSLLSTCLGPVKGIQVPMGQSKEDPPYINTILWVHSYPARDSGPKLMIKVAPGQKGRA